MDIKRCYQNIEKYLSPNKVLVIYGARRVGKTTLMENYLKETKYKYKYVSGDNIRVQSILSSQDFSKIMDFVEGYELLVIDESQNIPNIGMGLKIIVDQVPGIRVLISGSSSFDLSNMIGEPLVGRKNTLRLFPVAQMELASVYNKHELKENLEDFLIFGSYPEIRTIKTKLGKISALNELTDSYLFKDIFTLERIKSHKSIVNLLKLLSFQIGSEVSLNELSKKLGIDVKTVSRYLDLLEKSFIIKSLSGFSRNLRKEVSQKDKYYFLDLGIRNSIISNLNGLEDRNDIGQLWENFLFIERIKCNEYSNNYANIYFWRTYDQQEIDYIEEKDGLLSCYEFKYNNKKVRAPKPFLEAYSNSSFRVVHRENYLEFIGVK